LINHSSAAPQHGFLILFFRPLLQQIWLGLMQSWRIIILICWPQSLMPQLATGLQEGEVKDLAYLIVAATCRWVWVFY